MHPRGHVGAGNGVVPDKVRSKFGLVYIAEAHALAPDAGKGVLLHGNVGPAVHHAVNCAGVYLAELVCGHLQVHEVCTYDVARGGGPSGEFVGHHAVFQIAELRVLHAHMYIPLVTTPAPRL